MDVRSAWGSLMHGDTELIRLNYVLWPDDAIGAHTRVDIANEAIEEIGRIRARVAALDDLVKDWIDTAQQQSKLKDTAEARVAELESDRVAAAALEMCDTLGLDPNGSELADLADERGEGS